MELIDTRIYDDFFLLAKILEKMSLSSEEKKRLYKHFEKPKRGRWIEDEYGIPHCSECGTINNTVYKNFCPNCGADMRERREDGTD